MVYAIQPSESAGDAILRILREQIARARAQLHDPHEARKRFKETRALLRLARGPLGGEFAATNALFRDASRAFAAARDADAVIEALRKLDTTPTVIRRNAVPPVDLRDALLRLSFAEARITNWSPLGNSLAILRPGLTRTYRDGRRAFQTAKASGKPEDFHAWRKRVKDHWHHAQLLQDLAPDTMKPYADIVHELADKLGDLQDLVMLRKQASSAPLLDAIDKRRSKLERDALALGECIYARPKPRAILSALEPTPEPRSRPPADARHSIRLSSTRRALHSRARRGRKGSPSGSARARRR